MKIDYEKLKEQLKNLTGKDFADAEKAERTDGNVMPIISFATSFQVRLAAKALKTNPHELLNLPLNQYVQVANTVSNFFYATSDEDSTETDEASQKTPSEK